MSAYRWRRCGRGVVRVAGEGGFPSRGVWRRPALRWVDVLVTAALLSLLYGLLRPACRVPKVLHMR
ncbi:hypothetical protein [Kitasatospora sp. NPDC092286]|uniref:hypothetical protein n=1 Tax=Kitasatospora sp. NPDC092286 TaxID=3364087 RepID=UPI0037F720F3